MRSNRNKKNFGSITRFLSNVGAFVSNYYLVKRWHDNKCFDLFYVIFPILEPTQINNFNFFLIVAQLPSIPNNILKFLKSVHLSRGIDDSQFLELYGF